ncbi:guanine nucleotide-binding protein subunit alpha [Spinellus fusiger]|nr:guanine nucleotide-binding protein subunit alpha [Spinellus fusiger]
MGCCVSTETADKDAKQRSRRIDKTLHSEKGKSKNEVKLLLLGTGESGKSTILKQMRLIHEGGFSATERMSYHKIIISNTIQSMQTILQAMAAMRIELERPENIRNSDICLIMSPDLVKAIEMLWVDQGVLETYKRNNEYQLIYSAAYYFDSVQRIGDLRYLPTDQDLLQSRVKTAGITETKFIWNHLTYRMFDVGGQRSERKKWIHCFEDVTAILFLVAMSEYDQVLIEDESVNRMQEALILFGSIWKSRWFNRTSIILFLNKIDVLKEKLPNSKVSTYFPDYKGENDYESVSNYFKWRFLSLDSVHKDRQVYTHFTCATDTKQIKFVMTAVNDIVIQTNMRNMGLV